MNPASDMVVIGGGVVGGAVAYYAALKGLSVTLIDKPRRGRASSASAGGTWPLGESLGLGCGVIFYKTRLRQGHTATGDAAQDTGAPDGHAKGNGQGQETGHVPGPEALPQCFLDFSLRSNTMFPDLAADLERLSGMDVEFQRTSLLFLLLDDGDEAFARHLYKTAPCDKTLITWERPRDLAATEPALNPDNCGALRFHGDDQVNPYKLTDAFREAARALGVRLVTHTDVTGLLLHENRVTAVRTRDGDYPCRWAVNAAGSWGAEVGRMAGLQIPVFPVRGQIVCTETLPPVLGACLSTSDCYLAQKGHGEVIIGSTTERVGYDPGVTPEAMRELAAGAVRAVPFLSGARVKRVWSGFRPGTPDELPILGPVEGLDGYLNATGHFRTGILNAPLTGLILSEIAAGEPPSVPVDPFLLSRFAEIGATKGDILLF